MITTARKLKLKTHYLKAWLVTTRPKTLILSVIPFLIGTLLAMPKAAVMDWPIMVFAIFSALFIQIGTNFINDVYDFKNNVDKPTRLGPKRGIQSGVLTPSQVFVAGMTCFAVSLFLGIPVVMKGGAILGLLLFASVCSGFLYTGGPKPLAYNGLGEVFVILFFGLASAMVAFYLQTGFIDAQIALVGLELGVFASIPIAINNLRDIEDDRMANKNTLAVLLGKNFARLEIAVFAFLPFFLTIYFDKFWMTWLPWASLPLAFLIVRHVWTHEPSSSYNKFLGLSILLYVLFNVLLVAGFLL